MKNKRMFRVSLWILFLSAFLLIHACSSHRVGTKKYPSRPVKGKGVYHVVERHQTLYRICKTYRVDINKVASLNGISDPSKIDVGQRIFIPGAKRVLKVEIVIDDVAAESGGMGRRGPKTGYGKMDFLWPLEGKISKLFEDGERQRHQGIDITAPLGTPIKASNTGKVVYSGNTIKGYGNLIILRHSEEYVTVYAHNEVNLVEEGMWVEKGKIIGKVGKTGRASGPHLHFEIRIDNKAVDPLLYLK